MPMTRMGAARYNLILTTDDGRQTYQTAFARPTYRYTASKTHEWIHTLNYCENISNKVNAWLVEFFFLQLNFWVSFCRPRDSVLKDAVFKILNRSQPLGSLKSKVVKYIPDITNSSINNHMISTGIFQQFYIHTYSLVRGKRHRLTHVLLKSSPRSSVSRLLRLCSISPACRGPRSFPGDRTPSNRENRAKLPETRHGRPRA